MVKASTLNMHRTADGSLRVEPNHPRHAAIDDDLLTAQVKWTNIGPSQRKVTARALMKVGLGLLWLAKGPHETFQSRYDHVRDAVLRRAPVPLKHGFGNSTFPNHALVVQVISDRLQTGLLVSLHYFGTELWAQSLGYEFEASAEFIAEDVDHQYVDSGNEESHK